jgi:hypothetical protein
LEGFSCHHEALHEALQGKWDGEEREREREEGVYRRFTFLSRRREETVRRRGRNRNALHFRGLFISGKRGKGRSPSIDFIDRLRKVIHFPHDTAGISMYFIFSCSNRQIVMVS